MYSAVTNCGVKCCFNISAVGTDENFTVTRRLQWVTLLFVLLLCCFSAAQAQSCTTALGGVVGWWPGNGNADDIIGGDNGVLDGVTFGAGEVGKGFSFNNAGVVSVPGESTLGLTSVTVEAWISMKQQPGGAAYVIATQGLPSAYENYGLYVVVEAGNPELYFEWGTYSGGSGNYYAVSTGTSLTVGKFHHVAVTADGTYITFYVDGNQTTQVAQTEPLTPNTSGLQIGSTQPEFGNQFDGIINELSIYSNALSASEIQAIHKAGHAGKCKGLTFSPASLKFPRVAVGTTSPPLTVKATNAFPLPVTVTSVTPSGDFAQTNSCPVPPSTLASGASCPVKVTFTPTEIGTQKGELTITGSAPASPQTVRLTGAATDVSLSPAALKFATQSIGTASTARTVTVMNVGSVVVDFTGSGIVVAGKDPADFIVSANTCGSSLAAGTNCTVSVEFTPTKTGSRSATLDFNDDGGSSPQTVALTGTGK
jgi:hypothetical protein